MKCPIFGLPLQAMLTKTKAIVLRSVKFGDHRLIVDLLTEAEGRVSVAVNIPKTQKGKLKKQYFLPLSLLDVEMDFRPNVRLQRLREAGIAHPFVSIPSNPHKLSISLFLAEFIYHCTRGEQQNAHLFAYIANSVRWLDGCVSAFANFHLVFMIRLSRFIGFFPNIAHYHEGDFFDLRAASFSSTAPLHADFLTPADAGKIGTLMRMNYESMRLFRMNHTDRNRIVDVLVEYYRLHVPGFPELRSLQVMKDLWAAD